MLQNFKKLLQFLMSSNEPPNIHCLFPCIVSHSNAFDWSNGILGRDFMTTSSCFLEKLEHFKANRLPKHKFLKVFFTLHLRGKHYKMGMIVDRHPAAHIDIKTKDASSPSPIISPYPLSLSPSPSAEHLQAALGKGGKSVTADDRVMISKFGRCDDLSILFWEAAPSLHTSYVMPQGCIHHRGSSFHCGVNACTVTTLFPSMCHVPKRSLCI